MEQCLEQAVQELDGHFDRTRKSTVKKSMNTLRRMDSVSRSMVKGVDNTMTEWNKGIGRESDAALQLARAYISEAPLPC